MQQHYILPFLKFTTNTHITSRFLCIFSLVMSDMRNTKRRLNKKVLLRERKRHTDRGVSSTPSAVLSGGRGVPTLAGGVPTLAGGYLPWPWGTYLGRRGGGYLPWPGGYPKVGNPPPPPGCGQTENITSRLVLRTRSVIKP